VPPVLIHHVCCSPLLTDVQPSLKGQLHHTAANGYRDAMCSLQCTLLTIQQHEA
jgi:hypothetical protein